MIERTYNWNGHTHNVSYPSKSDEEVAAMVRMLMRWDLEHEAVVCAARDRIMCLVKENEQLKRRVESLNSTLQNYDNWTPTGT